VREIASYGCWKSAFTRSLTLGERSLIVEKQAQLEAPESFHVSFPILPNKVNVKLYIIPKDGGSDNKVKC
jgi:hypothetical protein